MNIKTNIKTTIEVAGRIEDGYFEVPRETHYDGQEERWDTFNLTRPIRELNLPQGEYKITITIEKI